MTITKEKSILIIAPSLLAESLSLKLTSLDNNLKISLDTNDEKFLPELIIWNILSYQSEDLITLELLKFKEKYNDAKILVIFSGKSFDDDKLIPRLASEGLLLNPTSDKVLNSVNIIFDGGRVFDIENQKIKAKSNKKLSFNQKLLTSGVKQIDYEMNILLKYLNNDLTPNFYKFILKGRLRELVTAKSLLIFLWGSSLDLDSEDFFKENIDLENSKFNGTIYIKEKNNLEIWNIINNRLIEKYKNNPSEISLNNSTLILTGLRKEFISIIIINTLKELDNIIKNFYKNNIDIDYKENSYELINQLKKNILINITDSYLRIKKGNISVSFNDFIFNEYENINSDFDIDAHDIFTFIDPIIKNEPLYFDGKLLPLYETESFIIFEEIISNWVIRTSNLLTSDIFNYCSGWPELRKILIHPKLQSTRSFERFRNNINNYDRWHNNIYMPIYLYESKREYIDIVNNEFIRYFKNENRETDLENLEWFQKQVTLLIEIRDALAPQLEIAVKYIGDLVVTILTKIIGKAIGLVGKGILQGMGRSNSK